MSIISSSKIIISSITSNSMREHRGLQQGGSLKISPSNHVGCLTLHHWSGVKAIKEKIEPKRLQDYHGMLCLTMAMEGDYCLGVINVWAIITPHSTGEISGL